MAITKTAVLLYRDGQVKFTFTPIRDDMHVYRDTWVEDMDFIGIEQTPSESCQLRHKLFYVCGSSERYRFFQEA